MRLVLYSVLVVLLSPLAGLAQDECPSPKPTRLLSAITPVIGQSPMWATTGTGPITWKGPNTPVVVVWVRDLSVPGQGALTGQRRGAPTAKVRFQTFGSTLGVKQERYVLDQLGSKPPKISQEDLRKYSFHQTEVWFPEPGCYDITARVGKQQAVIVLNIPKPGDTAKPGAKPAGKPATK